MPLLLHVWSRLHKYWNKISFYNNESQALDELENLVSENLNVRIKITMNNLKVLANTK